MVTNYNGLVQPKKIVKKPYFVGFSTVDKNKPPYTLTNIELIKRDINNHFATPMGSRVMLPNFGTRIYEMLFDPFDDYTKTVIIEDAMRVIREEPRVALESIEVFQEDQMLTIVMVLLFKPDSITDSMFVTFSLKDKEST